MKKKSPLRPNVGVTIKDPPREEPELTLEEEENKEAMTEAPLTHPSPIERHFAAGRVSLPMEENEEGAEEEGVEEGSPSNAAAPPPKLHDNFLIYSDAFDPFLVKGAELPKMIFSTHRHAQSLREKSVVTVYLQMIPHGVELGMFKKLMEASKKAINQLDVKWVKQGDNKVVSTWEFGGARIQGIDFGNASYERSEPNIVVVEFVFDTITIDGIQF